MQQPQIVGIDGPPRIRQTAAADVGRRFVGSRILSQRGHLLLVGVADERGAAAFTDIPTNLLWNPLRPWRWKSWNSSWVPPRVPSRTYSRASHAKKQGPCARGMHAPETVVTKFRSDLQDRVESTKPRLV